MIFFYKYGNKLLYFKNREIIIKSNSKLGIVDKIKNSRITI